MAFCEGQEYIKAGFEPPVGTPKLLPEVYWAESGRGTQRCSWRGWLAKGSARCCKRFPVANWENQVPGEQCGQEAWGK